MRSQQRSISKYISKSSKYLVSHKKSVSKNWTLNKIKLKTRKNQMFTFPFRESLPKTFVFQHEQTQKSTILDTHVSSLATLIDISGLLQMYCPISDFKVSIYDPDGNKFVSLQKINALNGLLPRYYFDPTFIFIRFKKICSKKEEQNVDMSYHTDSRLKIDGRSKERTIEEVIAFVKRWRQLTAHRSKPGNRKKRMNLQEAARQVGIKKKSLDDYYCQLRLAELHNFNFEQNMNQKMGKLRSYVRQHRVDQSIRIRHRKHPLNLKVIEDFVVDKKMEDYIELQMKLADEQKLKEEIQVAQIQIENSFLNDFSQHKLFDNIEDEFYKGFQFLLDEPNDPFLNDNSNSKKKMFDEDSQGSLFF